MRKTSGGTGPWRWELSDVEDRSVGIFGDTYTISRENQVGDFDQLLVGTEIEAEILTQALNSAMPLVRFAEDNDREYLDMMEQEAKLYEWERHADDTEEVR